MTQLWKIKGQVYTHDQLMELKKQGLDPHKDDIVMKFITNPKVEEPRVGEPVERVGNAAREEVILMVADEEEFARLKAEKAWLKPAKKARYAELKAKFVK